MFDIFYRAGALVFGGGHVVLPLLQTELVPEGWLTDDGFLAGYGAAQALPGPLFALASYLGAVTSASIWLGATIATVAIFLPAFLLLFADIFQASRRKRGADYSTVLDTDTELTGVLISDNGSLTPC